MDKRLTSALKLSIIAVLVACIGPANSLFFYSEGRWLDLTFLSRDLAQYLIDLLLLPFFCLSVYFSLKGKVRFLLVWFGMLAYYLNTSTMFSRGITLVFILSLLSFSLLLFCLIRGLIYLDSRQVNFSFQSRIPRYSAIFVFLLNIARITGPLALIYYISYNGVRIDPEHLYGSILRYDHNAAWTQLYEYSGPFFIWARPEMDVPILVPLYCFAVYLLLRERKWGYIVSTILLVMQMISAFLFAVPGVFAMLGKFSYNVLEFFRHETITAKTLYKLPPIILEMRLMLFFCICLLSIPVLIMLMRGLRIEKKPS